MVSDMVRRGTFHRHIMTSGGRSARPARAGQSDIDRELPAIPAVQTAETQTAVTVVLMESSRILEVYVAALDAAVPECTCDHGAIQHNRALRTPAGRRRAGDLDERAMARRTRRRHDTVRHRVEPKVRTGGYGHRSRAPRDDSPLGWCALRHRQGPISVSRSKAQTPRSPL
jgi:hypothetical protein